jgi:FixJ family two-component response regulator
VDDDPDVREALKALFDSVSLRCELFGSATQFLTRKVPDGASCLVLDVRLPELSGLDVQKLGVRSLADLVRIADLLSVTAKKSRPS